MSKQAWLFVLLTVAAFAQRPQPAAEAPASGTAAISGKVVDAASGAPVRRAIMSAQTETRNARAIRAIAAEDGSFSFKDLPKGKYWIVAEKTGYLRSAYRGRTASSWGDPVEVADGQTKTGVEIAMARQAVIAGRVLDEAGEPAERVMVQAIRLRGGSTARPGGSTMTDDRGDFRLTKLSPGTYRILASRPDRGGEPLVERHPGKPATAEAPTYFPATIDAAAAAPVRVNRGEERTGAEIRLQRSVVVRVSGRVAGELPPAPEQGRRGGGVRVSLRPSGSGFFDRGGDTSVGADGSFEFRNVRPGEYALAVSGFGRQGPQAMGRQNISVGQQDVNGLTVAALAPIKVDGRVRADGEPPFDFGKLSLNLVASNGFPGPPSRASTGDNGIFSFPSVSREKLRLDLQPPKGVYVKAIYAAGQPLPGLEIDFSFVTGPLEVVLANKPASIAGSVEGGTPDSPRIAVWAVPDYQPFRIELFNITKLKIDSNQPSFTLDSLRPGTYRVAAFENADSDALNDPAFWEQFRERTASVKVSENEVGQVKLKLISTVEIDEN